MYCGDWRGPCGRAPGGLTTPLLPDDFLAVVDPLWSVRWPAGRVEAVRAETADATTLVVRAGRGWSGHHAAGQYVPVGVGIDGVLHWRTYSITTPPDGSGRFAITVRGVPDGRVSPCLAHRVRPGETLRLGPVQGDFVLPCPPPARLLFLTGGIGITPVVAMLRALALRTGRRPDTVLVHSAPDADRVVFGGELRAMAARENWFTLHEHHIRREGPHPGPQPGGPAPGGHPGPSVSGCAPSFWFIRCGTGVARCLACEGRQEPGRARDVGFGQGVSTCLRDSVSPPNAGSRPLSRPLTVSRAPPHGLRSSTVPDSLYLGKMPAHEDVPGPRSGAE